MANVLTRVRAAIQVYRHGQSPWTTKASPFIWPAHRQGKPEWQLVDTQAYVEEGFNLNTLIYSAIMYKVRSQVVSPLRAYTGDMESPVILPPGRPLSDLVLRPNHSQSWAEFHSQNVVYLNLTGNCFITLSRKKKGGVPDEMYTLRPDRVYIVPGDDTIKGYLYVQEGKSVKDGLAILPQDMIHVKLPNPGDPLEGMGYGLSPVSPLARSADVDNKVTEFLKLFFDRGTVLSGLLKFDDPLEPETIATIRERWKEVYGGYGNWAEVGILDQGGDYQRLSMTFEEMGFEGIDERNESRVLGPFGVPPILIGSRIGLLRSTYCLPANSRISTSRGLVAISSIEPGELVWSFVNGGLEENPVTWSGCVGHKKLYEIKTKNRTLRATGNHPVLVRIPGNNKVNYDWRRVDKLAMEDYVVQLKDYPYGAELKAGGKDVRGAELDDCLGFYKIVSIRELGKEPVYDIAVEGGHSFVADGVVVHNSNYELARKAFWEDTMVPEVKLFESEFQYHLRDGNAFVAFDFSGVPALQKDVPLQVDAWTKLVDRGIPKMLAATTVGLVLADVPDGGEHYSLQDLAQIGSPPDVATPKKLASVEDKGGEGSGNYGHSGLPGVWGGSAPGGGSSRPDRRLPGPSRPPSNEGRFIESASKSRVEHYETYGGGINNADRATYEDDGDGIWKELEGEWHDGHAEVLVYELAQALGLNIVPPTVYSELDGIEGASQFFIEGAISGREMSEDDLGRILGGEHPSSERILLLDHLIGNKDRHPGNWMIDDDDGLWAVDNGFLHWGEFGTPLANRWTSGSFLIPEERRTGEHTFSPNMMSRINKFVGKTPKRPGPEYQAFVKSFSKRVRENRMEQIDSVWLNMVDLVGDKGLVQW